MKQVQRTMGILAVVFMLLSVALLAGGGIVYMNYAAWKRNALPVTAVVTDSVYRSESDTRYIIAYDVDGVTYDGALNYSDSSLYTGRKVEIYVNPDNPREFRTNAANIVAIVFGAIGGSFLIPAVVLCWAALRGRGREKRMKAYGMEIVAEIMEVQPTALSINNRRTYAIYCRWKNPQDDTMYIFRSAALTLDPTVILQERAITALPVWVDRHNYHKYWVDLSAVEEKVVVL